jgi:Ca2+-binding EF-hand superfamily protein
LTSISSLSTTTQTTYRLSLDTNGDGTVSADELAASKTSGSSSKSSSSSTASDSGDGGSSADLLAKLSSIIMAMLLQMGSSSDGSNDTSSGEPGSGDSAPQQLSVSDLDTDADGKVSATEFAAAKPDDVTDEMSAELFAKLDSDGNGAVDETELQAMQQGPEAAQADDAPTSSALDQLMEQIQAIARQYLQDMDDDTGATTQVARL